MNCSIIATPDFRKNLKKLSKRYKSMKADFEILLKSLKENPTQGIDLGKGLHKIRFCITSKGKGKSGGGRVITFTTLVSVEKTEVLLIAIYDKSDRESISDKELKELLWKNEI